jgi:hypothetical protein
VLDTIIGYLILATVAGLLLTAIISFAVGMFIMLKDSGIFGVLAGLAGITLLVMAIWPPFVLGVTFNALMDAGLSDTWSAFISIASVFIATGIGYCLLIESSDGRFKRKISK